MFELERAVKEAEIIKWSQENRRCKITEVPHWVIMALMEDHTDRHYFQFR